MPEISFKWVVVRTGFALKFIGQVHGCTLRCFTVMRYAGVPD